jgi:DNA-binding GntR family transcriptional regulator
MAGNPQTAGHSPHGRMNLNDDIQRAIRGRILTGQLKPGEKLHPAALAEEFGVSSLPVREALITLASEGLIENIPRRGSFVAHFSPDDIKEQFQIYGAVAGLASAWAAKRRTAEDLRLILDLTDKLTIAAGRPSKYESLSFEWHRAITHAAQSTRLTNTLRTLFRSMPMQVFQANHAWVEIAERHHRPIAQAIAEQRAEDARELMEKYLFAYLDLVSESDESFGLFDQSAQ